MPGLSEGTADELRGAALLAAGAFVVVVVVLMVSVVNEKATLEAFERFPPVLRRAGVSKMAF
jgi:hypothetical protein